MADVNMADPPEMLATRRSKRSTAGNRMEAALAEMALEVGEAGKDIEDDNDFVNEKDEEDIFVGSDFESTDEEEQQQVEASAEAEVEHEERRARKAARSRLEKTTAAAHAKHKGTFNPDIRLSSPVDRSKPKPKPRVSLGVILDAESGEVIETEDKGTPKKKRMSKRKHTVLNTSATVTRLKESEAKKASQPKKAKIEHKQYTQAELIARALDAEESNIIEHRDYLKIEDEKRKRARVVRTTTEGPLLRWVSRIEEEKVEVPRPTPPPQAQAQPQLSQVATTTTTPTPTPAPASVTPYYSRSVYGPPGSLFTPTTYTYSGGTAMVSTIASSSSGFSQGSFSGAASTFAPTAATATASQPSTIFQHYQRYLESTSAASPFPTWPPAPPPPSALTTATSPSSAGITTPTQLQPQPTQPALSLSNLFSLSSQAQAQAQAQAQSQTPSQTPQVPQTTSLAATPLPPPKDPEPEYKLETVAKNYLVHELAQHRGAPKPSWTQSMEAMFGDHVRWDEVRVYVGKNRPLSRIRHICPITGRQAHYLDPRSGVPYADSRAYKVLTSLLRHEYVWSATKGCYLNYEPPPAGVSPSARGELEGRGYGRGKRRGRLGGEGTGEEMDVREG